MSDDKSAPPSEIDSGDDEAGDRKTELVDTLSAVHDSSEFNFISTL